jgi:hypothetical protein
MLGLDLRGAISSFKNVDALLRTKEFGQYHKLVLRRHVQAVLCGAKV